MKRVTQTAILARAINDCQRALNDQLEGVETIKRIQGMEQAAAFHEALVTPLQDELETLMTLYYVETGTQY